MSETESILVKYTEDAREGFYRLTVMTRDDFRTLCRTIGGQDKLIELRTSEHKGRINAYICKVPIQFWPGLARKKHKRQPLTPEQKERAVANLVGKRGKI